MKSSLRFILRDCLRWIVTARMKRVAAADAHGAFPGADDWTVFLNCQDEIVTAGWFEPAMFSEKWTNRQLIKSHARNQHAADELIEQA